MTIKTYRELFKAQLSSLYPQEEISSFEQLAFAKYTTYTPAMLVMHANQELAKEESVALNTVLERLQYQEPIQYILGDTEFYGLPFQVNPATLIPRPETEELVDWILTDLDEKQAYTILDIGTGSGCIGISLKKNRPAANVVAYDISLDALDTAQANAQLNKAQVQFEQIDILKTTTLSSTFDCIVSNPPYVRQQEQEHMKPNVLDYEPHQALFVPDDDALVFYKHIGKIAKQSLTPNGVLFFEINQYLGTTTVNLLKDIGFTTVELRKDLSGNDRMIKASI